MMDEAAAREIERWKARAETAEAATNYLESVVNYWHARASESERQRKALAEHLEALGVEGINAATGAGK